MAIIIEEGKLGFFNEEMEEWMELYKPESDEEGNPKYYETFGEDLEYVKSQPKELVWTLTDCGDGLYWVKDCNFVNRINYVVCLVPWTEESKDYPI